MQCWISVRPDTTLAPFKTRRRETSGTLRISSSGYFPGGDWGRFLGTSGGTVEYYETAPGSSTPTTLELHIACGGTATITTYYNLTTLPYNNFHDHAPEHRSDHQPQHVGWLCDRRRDDRLRDAIEQRCGFDHVGGPRALVHRPERYLQYMNSAAAQSVIPDSDVIIAAGGSLQVRNAARR